MYARVVFVAQFARMQYAASRLKGNYLQIGKLEELMGPVVPPVIWLHIEHPHVSICEPLEHLQHLPGLGDVAVGEVVELHLPHRQPVLG